MYTKNAATHLNDLCSLISKVTTEEEQIAWHNFDGEPHEDGRVETQGWGLVQQVSGR